MTTPAMTTHAILYTDGSATPNPGYGGWGIHGYTYQSSKVKTLGTQKKAIVTNDGYLNRDQFDPNKHQVHAIENKIEAWGANGEEQTTNNNMELKALEKAFEMIDKQNWASVKIYSDSQYAINAMSMWYEKWVKNDWHNSRGQPVEMKDTYIRMKTLLDQIRQRVPVTMHYIKGHAGHYGNEAVDKLAKYGSFMASKGSHYEEVNMDVKKPSCAFHDLFSKQRWYFYGHPDYKTDYRGGYYWYYVGALGKKLKDVDVGMHCADGYMSIVLLKEPEPILEAVQSLYHQKCKDPHGYNYVVAGNLATVLTPQYFERVMQNNLDMIVHDKDEKVLCLPSRHVVCMEYNPMHLAQVHLERYEILIDILHNHLGLTSSTPLCYTDVTSYFVQVVEDKKGKPKYQLNPAYAKQNCLDVPVTYPLKEGTAQATLRLTQKTDGPDKMHMQKLIRNHGEQIKIEVVTYHIADDCFRYATLVTLPDAYSIWTNYDTSVRIVKPSSKNNLALPQ